MVMSGAFFLCLRINVRGISLQEHTECANGPCRVPHSVRPATH